MWALVLFIILHVWLVVGYGFLWSLILTWLLWAAVEFGPFALLLGGAAAYDATQKKRDV